MDWMKQLGGVLDRYADRGAVPPPDAAVHEDFDQFVRAAPPDAVADGLSAAFRSEHTPPFPLMATQLFGRANGAQRANILSMLLTTVGPLVVQQLLARRKRGTAASGQGGALGQILRGGPGAPPVTPQIADQLDPQDVEDIARAAEKKDPSVIDRISEVFAQQPYLVKMLGGAALAIALGRMAERRGAI